jgi:DNA-binding PadR family transcriptional regulator
MPSKAEGTSEGLGPRSAFLDSPKHIIHNGAMQEVSLTPTSYIVLGLLEQLGGGTPYDLKRRVAESVGNFWSVPHSALYAEPERLEAAGFLTSEREERGRRRKRYSVTTLGRDALEQWRATVIEDARVEMRDLSLLKLHLGADPATLAPAQLEAHKRKLAAYERRRALDPGTDPRGPWLTLDAGIAHEREWVRFWTELMA